MTFEEWLTEVDDFFIKKVGMGHEDWPDQCWHDWYSDGVLPREAVALAVNSEYGYDGCEDLGLLKYL